MSNTQLTGRVRIAKAKPGEDDRVIKRGWSRLRRDPGFWAGFIIVALFMLMALVPAPFASVFGNGDPDACQLVNSRKPPTDGHPFGFTVQGCDMFTHVVYGSSNSITIGIVAAGLSAVFGALTGILAGYFGGVADGVLSRLAEIIFALPMVLGAIVILSAQSTRGVLMVSITLAVLTWVPMMRVVRSSTISARSRSYISAAVAMGRPAPAIIWQHILPNVSGPILVIFTTSVGAIIGAEATLTYLGIGLQVPAISWGLQLGTAQRYFAAAPHLLIYPVLALTLAVAGFILLGDALRRTFGVQRDAI